MSSCLDTNIKTGDLLAWSGNGPFGYVVRFFTMSEFSHVGIAVVEDDSIYVVEAIAPRVRKVKLDNRMPLFHIPMNLRVGEDELDFLHSLIGAKYSYLQALMSYFRIHVDDNKWYCTELAYAFYKKLDLEFDKKLTPTRFINQAIMKFNRYLLYIESV